MGLEIRIAQATDVPSIKEIADANKREIGFIFRSIIAASIDAKELLVAVINQQIVGFMRWHRRKDGWSTVYEICVDQRYRGKGAGRLLLQQIPRPIRLKCPVDNASNRFYERLGFQCVSQEMAKIRMVNLWQLRDDQKS